MRLSPCVLLAFCSGCYRYAAIAPVDARPGTQVRARISAVASDRLSALLGASAGRELRGTVYSASPDSLVVEIPSVADVSSPGGARSLYQRVTVARDEVLEIEARSLDRVRTGAIAAVATIIAGAAVVRALRGEPGLVNGPGGGGPAESRSPLSAAPSR